MIYSFGNHGILILAFIFLFVMNMIGYIKKKGAFALITMIFSITSLYVHVKQKDFLGDTYFMNVMIDLFALGFSMISLLIMDEFETRRSIIKGIFKNRYDNK